MGSSLVISRYLQKRKQFKNGGKTIIKVGRIAFMRSEIRNFTALKKMVKVSLFLTV